MARKKLRAPAEEASVADLVPPPNKDERLQAMAGVASGMKAWRPARQVLLRVQAVPTCFPQFDKATRVGGLPLGRIVLLHGPSNHGKTEFAIGQMLSFLSRYHFVAHIDAEMTTPITWLETLMAQQADHPAFLAKRPTCYEETVDATREFLDTVGNARAKGIVPSQTAGLVVVDSVRKLVPKNLMKQLLKEGAEKVGIDGMRGRGAQVRAALNSQWMDELVPLLHSTNCTAILITRETEDTEADANDRKYGKDFKIGGGKALIYESSLAIRVQRASWVYQGSEADRRTIGERHVLNIWKTKVAGKDDKVQEAYYHTSNGTFTPTGFDRARDVLELAKDAEIVKLEGSWLHWGRNKWQGENQAVRKLTESPELLQELEERVRGGFIIEGQEAEQS